MALFTSHPIPKKLVSVWQVMYSWIGLFFSVAAAAAATPVEFECAVEVWRPWYWPNIATASAFGKLVKVEPRVTVSVEVRFHSVFFLWIGVDQKQHTTCKEFWIVAAFDNTRIKNSTGANTITPLRKKVLQAFTGSSHDYFCHLETGDCPCNQILHAHALRRLSL